jgi:hypothetical protein
LEKSIITTKPIKKSSMILQSVAFSTTFIVLMLTAQSASAQPITPTLTPDSSVGIGFLARDSVEPAQNTTTSNITRLATILPSGNQPITPMQFTPQIQGQDQEVPTRDDDSDDIIILSHRFNDDRFSSEIIGEIMNNDTRSYDKFDIDIYANFRDAAGNLISSEQGFIDAEELRPGQSSAFNIFIFGDDIADRSSNYDLIINDERRVAGQPLDDEFVGSNVSEDDDGDGNGSGGGGGGEGNGDEGDGGEGNGDEGDGGEGNGDEGDGIEVG